MDIGLVTAFLGVENRAVERRAAVPDRVMNNRQRRIVDAVDHKGDANDLLCPPCIPEGDVKRKGSLIVVAH